MRIEKNNINHDKKSLRFRIVWLLTVSIGIVSLLAVYYFIDPRSNGFMPTCPSKSMWGIYCAGCGSQRALHLLLHGDVIGSLRYNPMLMVFITIIFCMILSFSKVKNSTLLRIINLCSKPLVLYIVLAITIAFMTARNIHSPSLDFLRPPVQ